jgi:hypothetical protein
MNEKPGVSDRYRMASPWPVFVALGFVLSEIGIFLGVLPVAVGGVLLFGGSIAGILTESEYVENLWKTTVNVGLALVVVALALAVLQGEFALSAALQAIETPNEIGYRLLSRGVSIGLAGVFLVFVGLAQIGRHPAR